MFINNDVWEMAAAAVTTIQKKKAAASLADLKVCLHKQMVVGASGLEEIGRLDVEKKWCLSPPRTGQSAPPPGTLGVPIHNDFACQGGGGVGCPGLGGGVQSAAFATLGRLWLTAFGPGCSLHPKGSGKKLEAWQTPGNMEQIKKMRIEWGITVKIRRYKKTSI